MSDVAAQVAADIKTALSADELEMPSLPEVALEIRDVAESEWVSAVNLAAVVGRDPGMAAQIVRAANSPMFRAANPIEDLSQAISRIGVEYAANTVTSLAMKQMFQATTELVEHKIRQVWRNAAQVAAWSTILTRTYTRLQPDQAALAGLTHCIGVLPILSWVEENEHLVRDSMTLDRVIDSLHPTLGTMILKHWNFPDEIIAVPENYQTLDRRPAKVDYVDIVLVSNLICANGADHDAIEDEWDSSAAFKRIGIPPLLDDLEFDNLLEEVSAFNDVFD